MSDNRCRAPRRDADLIDYLRGELPAEAEHVLEEHLFDCPACTEQLARFERIGAGIRDLVAGAMAGGVVNHQFVERLRQSGLSIREYRLTPGVTVSCQAGPEDYVLVRMAAEFGSLADVNVEVEFHDLERNAKAPVMRRQAEIDRAAGELMLVFPGTVVRSYPRSLWTMQVHGRMEDRVQRFGPFIMDHTP